jgi:recombinational DNA repair protein (RecF pathway)
MTSPRTYRALGLTLRRSPVREADLLTVVYTREQGNWNCWHAERNA